MIPSRPLVIAHRGASAHAPEHTLAAYDLALASPGDGVECDVRLTSDAELVCVHDRTADRTSSGTGVVSTSTLDQLREFDWGSWHPSGVGRQDLLTLRDLLARLTAAQSDRIVCIETKPPSRFGALVERRLVEVLRDFGLTVGDLPGMPRVRVMSFSVTALQRMHQLAPRIPLVQLLDHGTPRPTFRGALAPGIRIAGVGVDFVRRGPRTVQALQERGHQVYVWTVNDRDDFERCQDLGVDAVITDDPALLTSWRATSPHERPQ